MTNEDNTTGPTMSDELIRPGSRLKLGDVEGEVTEMGVEWDSPGAEEMHRRLVDHINRHIDKVMQGAQSWDRARRQERAHKETEEARRQAADLFAKHTRTYARISAHGAGD
jgi:hypothetical protein